MPERRVGILISGRGSNMVALLDAMLGGQVRGTPALVLSNVPGASGLELAAQRGVPTAVVDQRQTRSRRAHEEQVVERLREQRVDWVCLAGYMRLLSPLMVSAFRGRLLNIHPSLLPAFPGLEAQRQALEHGAKVTGCTVHLVDEQCDHGPILVQSAVEVREGDNAESLSARILEQEHRIYPQALSICLDGRVRLVGRRAEIGPVAAG